MNKKIIIYIIALPVGKANIILLCFLRKENKSKHINYIKKRYDSIKYIPIDSK